MEADHVYSVGAMPCSLSRPSTVASPRSEWIDLGRVLATVSIVYFHLPSSFFASHGYIGDAAFWAFDNPLGPLAFFFLFSGYFTKHPIALARSVKKTVALLLPYLLWNLVCLPGTHDKSLLLALTGWGANNDFFATPADYPLWFVRDLMVLTLLSPLLQKGLPFWIALFASFVFAGDTWHCSFMQALRFPQPSNILLFSLGLLLSRVDLATLHACFRKYLPVVIISLVAFYTLRQAAWLPNLPIFKQVVGPLLMVGALLLLSEAMLRYLPKTTAIISSWAPACFFIYAAHAPAIILIAYCVALLDPNLLHNQWVLAITPLLIISCALAAFCILRHYSPSLLLPLFAHEGRLSFLHRTKSPGK